MPRISQRAPKWAPKICLSPTKAKVQALLDRDCLAKYASSDDDDDVDGGDDDDEGEDGVEVVGLARQAKRISGLCLL